MVLRPSFDSLFSAIQREENQKMAEVLRKPEPWNNEQLLARVTELKAVLTQVLSEDYTSPFDRFRLTQNSVPFLLPKELETIRRPPDEMSYFASVPTPGFFGRLLPGNVRRHHALLEQAASRYQQALREYEEWGRARQRKIEVLRAEHENLVEKLNREVRQRNKEVDELETAYRNGEGEAILLHTTLILARSDYPKGFPRQCGVRYVPESRELVLNFELPKVDVVPKMSEFRYIKSRQELAEKPQKQAEIKELYQDIVSALALRTLHQVFKSDQGNYVQVVAFSGFIDAVDPATGKDIRPYLVSLRATKERFQELDLRRVDKRVCLRNLGAQVSPEPTELVAIKPVVEFDMVDKRFVEQKNILADLDSRPNLMELNPFEFEALVSDLFGKLGLETKLTRSSRDGGVDAVAFDTRPVLGGKVVIQAKRYRDTVGVAAVRDLYGTMINEGANKGILVTTSGYGPDAFEFAKDKPIELISGGGLLALLEQVGVKARIVFPAEQDPVRPSPH